MIAEGLVELINNYTKKLGKFSQYMTKFAAATFKWYSPKFL